METPARLLETIIERTEAYGKTTYELSKLRVLETVTKVFSSVVPRMCVVVIFLLFVLVLNVGIALYVGELLGRSYYGFFIVSAFFLVVSIVLYFFLHRWIKKPLSDFIIKQALQ